jgi:Holliday junction resolvase RusA-like endonuclease
MTTITVHAVPVAQPRQRSAVIAGKVRTYTPTKHPVNAYKASVAHAWGESGVSPLDGPVSLTAVFVLPRPQSKTRKHNKHRRLLHASKPDVDNLVKGTKDALKGLAWRDDSQVQQCHLFKFYAACDEQPHVELTVTLITEP